MSFYVDGQPFGPTSPGIDIDIPPEEIEALEVYKSAQVPAQFGGATAGCGVIVIWTRDRAAPADTSSSR